MEPRFTHRDSFSVAGIKRKVKRTDKSIPKLWDDLFYLYPDIPGIEEPHTVMGIYFHSQQDIFDGIHFNYLFGIELPGRVAIPPYLKKYRIPAADYAVFEHIGPPQTLVETYHEIYNHWLPDSPYKLAGEQDLEIYGDRFNWYEPDSVIEVWIPVKRK